MAVPRRLRFEVLRRDNYTCRYCGGRAPDVELHVDHIIPVALGGTDDPANLTTACVDCNHGKASVPADAPTVEAVDVLNDSWRDALARAAAQMDARAPRNNEDVRRFDDAWSGWYYKRSGNTVPRDPSWAASVVAWIESGLTIEILIDLIPLAMSSGIKDEWRYFCGCAWRRVREVQELAAELLAAEVESNLEEEFEADLRLRDERLTQQSLEEPTSIGDVLRRLQEGTHGP